MLSMQLSKRFVQQIVLDGFAFVGILNNLLDCYKLRGTRFALGYNITQNITVEEGEVHE